LDTTRKVKSIGNRLLPLSARRRLVRLTRWPPVGWVRFGQLRRLKPISTDWGTDRGQAIDRYYIERFLSRHQEDIGGRVLEIGDNSYTRAFGGERVTHSDVLHVAENRPHVTVIDDLTRGERLPSDSFDCVILTQTLQLIYDVPAALATVCRILKPGAVTLVTVPGISKISRYDMDRWGHYWSFTTRSVERLFEPHFRRANMQVKAHGNVLAAVAFLQGLAAEELAVEELDWVDPDYELLITVRAVKAGSP
jgi:SAM-dependent methyltransferase